MKAIMLFEYCGILFTFFANVSASYLEVTTFLSLTVALFAYRDICIIKAFVKWRKQAPPFESSLGYLSFFTAV